MKKYRIHWKAVLTDATGHGTGSYPKAEAERYAELLNEEKKGITQHWVEEVKDDRSNS